jgi:SAM-dependent methyltransferase
VWFGARFWERETTASFKFFASNHIDKLSVRRYKQRMPDDGELSTGRDFSVYKAGMDAGLALKIADIAPHIRPDFIVDKGCGTGKLLLHLSAEHPSWQFIGIDRSEHLLETARNQPYPHPNCRILKGDIIEQHFPRGSVRTSIFSSVIHEIFSYNGYDLEPVRRSLRNTWKELGSHGRIIIRDGVKPAAGNVWMRCDVETETRFRRFAREFKHDSSTPGVVFEEHVVNGQTWFILTRHDANEFLSKKDYLENWAIEVQEEFGVFTLDEWISELRKLGYQNVEARSYINPWILEHRYRGRVWLHEHDGDRPGKEEPFPDTTAVIVAEAV